MGDGTLPLVSVYIGSTSACSSATVPNIIPKSISISILGPSISSIYKQCPTSNIIYIYMYKSRPLGRMKTLPNFKHKSISITLFISIFISISISLSISIFNIKKHKFYSNLSFIPLFYFPNCPPAHRILYMT